MKTPFIKSIASSRLVLPLFFLFLLFACGSIGSFHFTEESEEITIQGQTSITNSLPLGDLFPTTIPITVNLEQELAEQDATGARAVYLTELFFELTPESSAENFNFLNEIILTVGPRESSSDLPTRRLASSSPVPEGQSQFFLDIEDDLDLKPYIESGMRLRTNASGSAPSSDAVFKVFATFRVQVL